MNDINNKMSNTSDPELLKQYNDQIKGLVAELAEFLKGNLAA